MSKQKIRNKCYKLAMIDSFPSGLSAPESDDHVDLCESSVSSEDGPITEAIADASTLDFMKLAESLPPSALLHLMKSVESVAKAKKPEERVRRTRALVRQFSRELSKQYSLSAKNDGPVVRFATDDNGNVKCDVRTFIKDSTEDMFWNSREMEQISNECRKLIRQYSKYCGEYIEHIEQLSLPPSRKPGGRDIASMDMSMLEKHQRVRGMELLIVHSNKEYVAAHMNAVLNEQDEQRAQGVAHRSVGVASIRRASMKNSRESRQLALRLAEYDASQAKQDGKEEDAEEEVGSTSRSISSKSTSTKSTASMSTSSKSTSSTRSHPPTSRSSPPKLTSSIDNLTSPLTEKIQVQAVYVD